MCWAIAALLFSSSVIAASSSDWRSRSIYQVLTDRFALANGSTTAPCDTADRLYCGGSWRGIIGRLDYIQDMGFDAVWISPVTKQIQGSTAYGYAYHGYWQQDLYQLNAHFGTQDDLKALSAALHSRGMYLMVDVVVNHNGWNGSPSNVDYSTFNPFKSQSQYHSYCAIDYNDLENATNIEHCWVGDTKVSLPDLRTEDADVKAGYQTWISQLINEYSIDGLRLDTVMQVDPGFWSGFLGAAKSYIVGEVDDGDVPYVCGFQNFLPGVLNYGTYFPLVDAFKSTSGSMQNLRDAITSVQSSCHDVSLLGTFSENHDQPRFASLTGDMALASNVIVFTLLSDGIPIIYEGQEQHYNALGGSSDPYNREAVWLSGYNQDAELYKLIQTLNAARSHAIKVDSAHLTDRNQPIYSDTTTIAMRKGNMVTVLSNKGSNGASYTQSIPGGYSSGAAVTELLTCTTLTADGSGAITVPMGQGAPRVYYPTADLSGSNLCQVSGARRSPTKTMRFMSRRHENGYEEES